VSKSRKPVTIDDVYQARERISDWISPTPLRVSPFLSAHADRPVKLKLETMHDTGAFKIRGASNALIALPKAARDAGVIAISSGNHGRGVAYAAARLGIKCVIYMSSLVPDVKVQAIRDLGADVVIAGDSQDEAEHAAMARVEQDNLTFIHPFDNPDVIAGQGTISLEILEAMPDVANVIVPLSGGGLFAGVAMAIKALKPDVRLIGVTMENGAAMIEALKAGELVPVEEVASYADALGGSLGAENHYTFEMTQNLIDETLLLSEEEIAAAMRTLFIEDRIVAEGGGAVGVGALMSGRLKLAPGPVAIIVSGCNIEMSKFLDIVSAC